MLLFTLLLAVVPGRGSVCPSLVAIQPCTCQVVKPKETEVWVTCSYIPSLSDFTTAVEGMKTFRIDKFVLEHSNVGYIPSNTFLATPIREIEFKSMTLDNIGSPGEYPFQGRENTLNSLAIRRCRLKPSSTFDWSTLYNLNTLASLEISKTDLSHFSPKWFKVRSYNLSFIYLTEDKIEEIDDNAFSDITKLRLVDLSENRIKKLKRSMFPQPAEFLTFFTANDNEIESLPDDMFVSMTALRRVNLANNRLRALDGRVWKQRFSQLTHLDLLGNPIQCDCKLMWTMGALPPLFYYGECENAKDGGRRKLSVVFPFELNITAGCTE